MTLNILIVEDNVANSKVAERLFRMQLSDQASIEVAKSFETALYCIRNKPYNLIYMDYNLDANQLGSDLITAIRNHQKTLPQQSVIFLCSAEKTEASDACGADLVIPKPFNKAALNKLCTAIRNSPDLLQRCPLPEMHPNDETHSASTSSSTTRNSSPLLDQIIHRSQRRLSLYCYFNCNGIEPIPEARSMEETGSARPRSA